MPTNVVKTKRDEKLWRKAKLLAKKEGKENNYAYIMSIFRRLKGLSDILDVLYFRKDIDDIE